MSLQFHRTQLEDFILAGSVHERIAKDPKKVSELILNWWESYKAWEEADTISKAYWNTRLAVRYSKRKIDEGVLSPIQAAKGAGGKTDNFEGYSNNVGLRGIVKRMDPEVFMNTKTQESKKTELGLHDLNASLMKPGKPITKQVYINEESPSLLGAHFALIGLSQPADQHLFALLNCIAKDARLTMPSFYQSIRMIRSQMTRVKLACEHDMGSSFTALDPDSKVNPRFKYYGGKTKVPQDNQPGKLALVPNTQALIHERKMKAINFKKIINEQFTYNEIVVAYRQHANPNFPLFCTWTGKDFECFKLTDDGHVGATIGRIADIPKQ